MEQVQLHWMRLKSSLWFFPGLLTALGMVLAMTTVRIDEAIDTTGRAESIWLFGGGASGARGVLSAIASTTVTVAGTVFSIVVVALQLASNQFTPRVMRAIMQDRVNQVTLGAFLGTFTYSLLVLRSVRSGTDLDVPFVPALAVSIAIVFALTCMGLLIYFIHHAARSMEASTVTDRVAEDVQRMVDLTFPTDPVPVSDQLGQTMESEPPESVVSRRSGYLASVDTDGLVALAAERGMFIRLEVQIGAFLLPGSLLATVWRPDRPNDDTGVESFDEIAASLRSAMQVLDDPGERDDLLYNMQRLADIAVKAMSPGINDPTTARFCIDRIALVLARAATRSRPRERFEDADGLPRVIWRRDPFDELVEIGFDQLGHYAASDLQVMLHLSNALESIVQIAPEHRKGVLRAQAALLVARGEAALATAPERQRFADTVAWSAGVRV